MEAQEEPVVCHPVNLLRFSPNRDFMAVARGNLLFLYDVGNKCFISSDIFSTQIHKEVIRAIAWSDDGTFLVTCGDDKQVQIWQRSDTWKFLGSKTCKKKALVALFAPNEQSQLSVIYADKFGEVWSFPVNDLEKQPKILLGHVSILTDMAMSPDKSLIITADKDEKLRVTHYPKTYDILSFCLGHTDYVTKIVVVGKRIFSGSGDGTVREWEYASGQLHSTLYPNCPFSSESSRAITIPTDYNNEKKLLTVLLEGSSIDKGAIMLYTVQPSGLIETQLLHLTCCATDAVFDSKNQLWVTGVDGHVRIFAPQQTDYVLQQEESTSFDTQVQVETQPFMAQCIPSPKNMFYSLLFQRFQKHAHILSFDDHKRQKIESSDSTTSTK